MWFRILWLCHLLVSIIFYCLYKLSHLPVFFRKTVVSALRNLPKEPQWSLLFNVEIKPPELGIWQRLLSSQSFQVLEFFEMLGSEMTQSTESRISDSEIKRLLWYSSSKITKPFSDFTSKQAAMTLERNHTMARNNFSCHQQHYIFMKLCLSFASNILKLIKDLSCLCPLTSAWTATILITHLTTKKITVL